MSGVRNLKLEVILAAVDKITRPLKAAQQGNRDLAKAVKDTKDRLRELNRSQADIDGFKDLRTGAAVTDHQLKAARERVRELGEAMAKTEAPTKAMAREFKAATAAAQELALRKGKLANSIKQTQERLERAGIDTKNLSNHQRQLSDAVRSANVALKEQEARLTKANEKQRRLTAASAEYGKAMARRNQLAGAGVSALAGGAVVGAPVLAMVKDYSSFEDAMLGVARQVEGARDAGGQLTKVYFDMADGIKAMAERIPMATTELAALVEAGARMGIQGKENLLTFAETTAITATAFDLPVDQVGEDMGKLANLYKIPIKSIGQLGDVINYLDDNALSKGGDIIEVMKRTAGIAGSVKMPYKEAAALGSTFLTMGASAEVAGTATNAMIRELAIATAQPKRFQEALQTLGLKAGKVQKGMATNATATIQTVLEAVKKLPQDQQLKITTKLFGKEYGDDAAKLAEGLDEYRRQLKLVNEEKAKGSMGREADAKDDTLSAQWQITKNNLFNQSSGLGATLKQPLVDLMKSFNGMLKSIGEWTKANPGLTSALVKTSAVLAVILATVGSLALALAAVLGPLAMVKYSVAVLSIKGEWLSARVLPAIGNALAWLGRLAMANPLGLVLTAVAVATLLIYKYWKPIKAFFSGLFDGIAEAFAPLGALFDDLKAAFEPLQPIFTAIREALGWLFTQTEASNETLTAFAAVGYAIGKILGWVIRAAIFPFTMAIKAMLAVFGAVSAGIGYIFGEVRSAFSGGLAGIGKLLVNWSPLGLLYSAFAGVLRWFGVDLPSKFTDFGGQIIKGLVNGITGAVGSVKAALAAPWLWLKAKASNVWTGIRAAAAGGLAGIGKLLVNWSPLGLLYSAFAGVLRWFGVDLPSKFTDFGGQIIKGLVNGITGAVGSVKAALAAPWLWLKAKASNVWTGIRAAAAGGLAGIGKLLVNWSPLGLLYSAFAGVLRWFGVDLPAKFTDFGSQIIKGLVNGITGAIGSVRDTIVKVAGSAIGWFKETLGIHSPSRVFAELGGFTMAGLDQGLTDSQGGPLRAIRDMAKQLTAAGAGITLGTGVAMADPVQFDHRQPLTAPAVAQSQGQGATLAAAPAQAGDTYIINVYPGGDADLAKQIRRELEAIQREKAARGRSRLVDHD